MPQSSDYITVVFRMPKELESRKQFTAALQLNQSFHGAEIMGLSLEDEITVLELIEEHEDFDSTIADDARAKAKELHEKVEI